MNILKEIKQLFNQAQRDRVEAIERQIGYAMFFNADENRLRSLRSTLGWARKKVK